MKRDIFQELIAWKSNPTRKPLLLMGARQVGKTFTLKAFAREHYTNHLYCNFELDPDLKQLFTGSLDPYHILHLLSIAKNISLQPTDTLLIFDEIQECPEALNCLKYFCELAPEYAVCAAGSLLRVTLAHTKGFPVGKVDFLHLYPLSFLEFLSAIGEEALKNYILDIKTLEPLPKLLHEKCTALFKYYLFIGGMPEAVYEYTKTKDILRIRDVQKNILTAYQLDFAKHAPKNQLMRITQVWENIVSQLSKENKKFIYSLIREGARAKEFEIAIQWLTAAGLLNKTVFINTPKIPLSGYAEFNFFKLYLLDVGLLAAFAQIEPKTILYGNDLFQELRGAISENYVAQTLIKNNFPLYYWASEGRSEIDFIIQHQQMIYPLEVKSGHSKHKKSLLSYQEKYHQSMLIRASAYNLKLDDYLLNIPLYLTSILPQLLKIIRTP